MEPRKKQKASKHQNISKIFCLVFLRNPVSSSDKGDSFALYVPVFQVSVFTLNCAAEAKRMHGPSNQDLNLQKQMLV